EFSVLASENGIGVENFDIEILPEEVYAETDYDEYEEVVVVLPESMTSVTNFAWHVSTAADATRIYITDIRVEEAIDCIEPENLSVEEFDLNSALLTWEPANDEDSQWEVIVQERG